MKKQILLSTFSLLCFSVSFSLQAQWTGTSATSTTDNATRMGKVGIGLPSTVIPGNELHVKAISPSLTSDVYLETLAGKLWILSSRDDRFAIMNSSATDYLSIINNGNIGIGITTPAAKLHVSGTSNTLLKLQYSPGGVGQTARIDFVTYNNSSSVNARIGAIDMGYNNGALLFYTDGDNIDNSNVVERMRISETGNVGIGTSSPLDKLEVASGNIRLYRDYFILFDAGSGAGIGFTNGALQITGGNADGLGDGGSSRLKILFNSPGGATINGSATFNGSLQTTQGATFGGQVSIGTKINNNTDALFSVYGTAYATKSVVTQLNWADDELVANVQSPTLAEEEDVAAKEQHLIGVPAETELKEKGLDLGEMQAIQMRKIEQLYKHLFALSRENENLKAEMKALKKLLKK